jgi:hypothetical protein
LAVSSPQAAKGEIMAQQLIEKILSRSVSKGGISMWGTLHAEQGDGRLVGWIVDTWTEHRDTKPHLPPKMHWVPRDGRLHHMQLRIDAFQSSALIGPEDTEVESSRAAFIKTTLGIWEQEFVEGKT